MTPTTTTSADDEATELTTVTQTTAVSCSIKGDSFKNEPLMNHFCGKTVIFGINKLIDS